MLSTNIAETSITIDDVVVVIDSGRLKENQHDPVSKIPSLQLAWWAKQMQDNEKDELVVWDLENAFT